MCGRAVHQLRKRRPCRLQRPNCCEKLQLLGVHLDGGLQGFLAVPIERLHKSDVLSLDQLALIETLGIGAHAVARGAVTPGENALVIGAGPIGLAVTQFALAAGATFCVAEQSKQRRAFVHQFGVEVFESSADRLADVVFDATGNPESMEQSLRSVAAAGRLVFVGLCRSAIPIDDPLLHVREVTLYASRNSCHQFPRVISLIEQGKIDTTPWITDRLSLSDVPTHFGSLRNRPGLVKTIVEVQDKDL